MKITHKTRLPRQAKPVEVSPEYQAEVDRSTARLEKRYEAAKRRVLQTEKRLEEARRHPVRRETELDRLRREVSDRYLELFELERLMTQTPAGGAIHRGTDSYRKVPR